MPKSWWTAGWTGALLLAATGATPALAQTEYFVRLGAVGSGNLLRDRGLGDITVRPSIAPMLALGASLPLGPRGYRLGVEGSVASGKFHSTAAGGDTELGTLRTATLLLQLQGPVVPRLRWTVGLGGIRYWPKDERGIFLLGGTTRFLAGAGADYRRAVLPRWDLVTSLRYDFHRFMTDQLEARGFAQNQGVSRVSLSIGLSRSPGR
jgi:hypothetical protein